MFIVDKKLFKENPTKFLRKLFLESFSDFEYLNFLITIGCENDVFKEIEIKVKEYEKLDKELHDLLVKSKGELKYEE